MLRDSVLNLPGYEQLSARCAEEMLTQVKEKPDAVFCLATGHSPLRSYRIFVKKVKEEALDISRMRIVKLDEWHGLPMEHPATCEFFLQSEIIKPLAIDAARYVSFNSAAADPQAECNLVRNAIAGMGGIDWIVLGVGKNGHLGLNEPGESLEAAAHVAKLDTKTKSHVMLTGVNAAAEYGMTLGLGEIMAARRAVLLITGSEKKAAVDFFLSKKISTRFPVSFLHLHPNFSCFLEQENHFPIHRATP